MAKQLENARTKDSNITNLQVDFKSLMVTEFESMSTETKTALIDAHKRFFPEPELKIDFNSLTQAVFHDMPNDTKLAILEARRKYSPKEAINVEIINYPKPVLNLTQSNLDKKNTITQQILSTYRKTIKPLGALSK